MKPPPSNRNVPKWMWEDACEKYEGYQRLHKMLQDIGLSDQAADEYIDAHAELSRIVDWLDPNEEDFRFDDHSESFAKAAAALAAMEKTLGYESTNEQENNQLDDILAATVLRCLAYALEERANMGTKLPLEKLAAQYAVHLPRAVKLTLPKTKDFFSGMIRFSPQ